MDIEKLRAELNKAPECERCQEIKGERQMYINACEQIKSLQAILKKRNEILKHKDREIKQLRDELAQAKAEITRLKHYENKCHDCPIVCAKTEVLKAYEEMERIKAENDRLRKERNEARVDCAVAEKNHANCAAELEQVKRERDAAISDLTYIARTYPVDLCDDLVCQYCKHYPNVNTGCPGWTENDCFEWRGQKEG